MKNFPDQMPLEEFNKRIGSYSEEPDDLVWKNIDAALRPNKKWLWLPWWDRVTFGIAGLLLLATFWNTLSDVKPEEVANRSGNPSLNLEHTFSIKKEAAPDKSTTAPGTSIQNTQIVEGLKSSIFDRIENEKISEQPVILSSRTAEVFNDSILQHDGKVSSELDLDSGMIASIAEGDLAASIEPIGKDSKRLPLKKLTLYAHATPMLTFQRVTPAAMDGLVVVEFMNPSILSEERFGVSFSAGIQGHLTRRLEYYGGVTFYRQKKTLRYKYQLPGQVDVETEGNNSYTVTPKYFTGQFNYSMTNAGVHGGLLFHLYGIRLSHKIGAGVSYFQGLGSGNTEVYKNAGSRYFSYQLLYRNEIIIGKRLKFFIQPTFTQAIQVDEELEAPFKLKPYSAGVGLGILYDFR